MSTMRDGGELARRLERQVEGEVLFDLFSRGRYATDASVSQVVPLGVVVPKTWVDVEATLRSEARRVGKEGVRTCRYRGSPDHCKKKKIESARNLIVKK